MDRTAVAGAFLAGLVVGALAVSRPGPVGAEPTPPARQADPPRPPTPPSPDARARTPAPPDPELEAARTEIALLRGQLSAFGGLPVTDWPPDLPDALRPGRVEERMAAEVAAVPGLVLERVDCAEFPCIAVLALPPTEARVRSSAEAAPAVAWLERELGRKVGVAMKCDQRSADGPQDCVGAVAFDGGFGDDGVDVRTDVRRRALFEEHEQAALDRLRPATDERRRPAADLQLVPIPDARVPSRL